MTQWIKAIIKFSIDFKLIPKCFIEMKQLFYNIGILVLKVVFICTCLYKKVALQFNIALDNIIFGVEGDLLQ